MQLKFLEAVTLTKFNKNLTINEEVLKSDYDEIKSNLKPQNCAMTAKLINFIIIIVSIQINSLVNSGSSMPNFSGS